LDRQSEAELHPLEVVGVDVGTTAVGVGVFVGGRAANESFGAAANNIVITAINSMTPDPARSWDMICCLAFFEEDMMELL
jgi:hypothetical protein